MLSKSFCFKVPPQEAYPVIALPLCGSNWIEPQGGEEWIKVEGDQTVFFHCYGVLSLKQELVECEASLPELYVVAWLLSLQVSSITSRLLNKRVCVCEKHIKWILHLILKFLPFLIQPCSIGKIKAVWTSTSLLACGSTSRTGRTSSGTTTGTTPASLIRTSLNRHWLDLVRHKVCWYIITLNRCGGGLRGCLDD